MPGGANELTAVVRVDVVVTVVVKAEIVVRVWCPASSGRLEIDDDDGGMSMSC